LPDAEALTPYIREIDANRWYSNNGPLVRRFESALAAHFGVSPEHVVSVCNATTGISLAIRAALERRGETSAPRRGCVVPDFTFAASGSAILDAGLLPIISDVDPCEWRLTPDCAEEAAAAATRAGISADAVMPVSLFGAPIDPAPWRDFERRTGAAVVVDAAWCFDSLQPSDIPAVVSLHATKVFGIGEGGVVVCTDKALIERIRSACNFGFDDARRATVAWGRNAKLSEYAAAVGLAVFDAWPDTRTGARSLAAHYLSTLAPATEKGHIQLAPGFDGSFAPGAFPIAIATERAETVLALAAEAGVEMRRWWRPVLSEMPAFAESPAFEASSGAQDRGTAWRLAEGVVCLPFHEEVSHKDVLRVVAALSM
jgi:dTDP-4-amino-4,6-dideoxygalactose transaminase